MITSRRPPRKRHLLVIALVASVLIHLFGGAFWPRITHMVAALRHEPPPQHEDVATSDVIRLEKRAVPRPQQHQRRRPQPRPLPPQPRPQPAAPRVVPLPNPEALRPAAVEPKRAKPQPKADSEIAHIALHKPETFAKKTSSDAPKSSEQRASLSSEQIAQLDRQFAKTIADAHTDVTTITQHTHDQPAAVKRYHMSFEGIHADLRRGEGTIEPVSSQRIGNVMWYYTHYTFMYADGHVEEDDIPWPFHYPVNDDPFARRQRKIPLQAPPAGFRPNRPLQPILMQFFGGPPVESD